MNLKIDDIEAEKTEIEKAIAQDLRTRRERKKLLDQLRNKEVSGGARNDVIRKLADLGVKQTTIAGCANLSQASISRTLSGKQNAGKPGPRGPIDQHKKNLRDLTRRFEPRHPHAILQKLRRLSGAVAVIIPSKILSVCRLGLGDYVWVEPEGDGSVTVRKATVK